MEKVSEKVKRIVRGIVGDKSSYYVGFVSVGFNNFTKREV